MATTENSLLNLDPESFKATLDELGIVGEERAFLEQQYFAQNRALPMTGRPEGRRVGTILPMSFPEGMTGAEAIMSGEWDFAVPEFIRGMYEAPAEAANVAGATVRGIPVTEQQMQEAATNLAGSVTGIGPTTFAARSLTQGVQMPDPSLVSMSGVRGMGDNGGPAMGPTRFVNPNTGLYSPSFEAAKTLPQEVGTPQQMRAMLLRGGAKEEELLYSGFDDWLKGRGDKVTKQEIQDVLGIAAAGVEGGTPLYARQSMISGGVTGVQGTALGDLQDRIYQQILDDYNTQRSGRLLSELQARGYSFPQIQDEASFRDFAVRAKQQYNNWTPASGTRRVPASLINSISSVEGLLGDGESFNNPRIQDIVRNRINASDSAILRPDGSISRMDEALEVEFPDEEPELELSRGFMPENVRDRAYAAYDMSPQEAADFLGVDVEDVLNNFNPDETQYGTYVMPGMRNYSENVFKFDDAGRGVLSGIEALGAGRFANPHFASSQGSKAPIMFHTRTGELQTPEGTAYHVAEIQSDIGQTYREDPNRFVVPGSKPTELLKSEKKILQDYVDVGKEFRKLYDQESQIYNDFVENYMGSDGAWEKNKPGYNELRTQLVEARKLREEAKERLIKVESDNYDVLYNDLQRRYLLPRFMGTLDQMGLSSGDFDISGFEQVLSGSSKPRVSGKQAALPFATSTNRWVDAALKNEIMAAATRGSEWITFPMGEDVARHTYGDVEGQKKFYEGIVPTRLKELSKKFLDGAEVQQIEAQGFGPGAPTYRVNAIRLTPELRTKLLEGGLPSFAKGGPVSGSSLDVDVFALD